MKTTKEQILTTALNMFSERGFDAVSTSMIAGELGITKGALYRHFQNKQEIFDSIIQRMFELDEERAEAGQVPAKTYEESAESYSQTEFPDFCEFVIGQFDFWTEDGFASAFRHMITIEQYKNTEMTRLYQDVLARGPVKYSEDLLRELIESGKLNGAAAGKGPEYLAMELFAPLQLTIQLADGGEDRDVLKKRLREITMDFEKRYQTDQM